MAAGGRVVVTTIRILGPVRAWRGDQELPLGSPQQRGVLVLLAVAGGRGVSMHTLIGALWRDHPPPSAVNVVQTYLKRLRRSLEPDRPRRGPSTLLPTVGDGYALNPERWSVDLWRFRALMADARRARHSGDQDRVASIVGEALGLWHGSPAHDVPVLVDHPWLRTVLGERNTAVGWCAEAALSTGRAAEVLDIVEDAVATGPLDERLHAYLIRLYHAVGRRSEAVHVYHTAMGRLRDDLGLDPGSVLSAAYQQLLRDELPGPG
jgi:DNA-binding SARP family transcriptional activator